MKLEDFERDDIDRTIHKTDGQRQKNVLFWMATYPEAVRGNNFLRNGYLKNLSSKVYKRIGKYILGIKPKNITKKEKQLAETFLVAMLDNEYEADCGRAKATCRTS